MEVKYASVYVSLVRKIEFIPKTGLFSYPFAQCGLQVDFNLLCRFLGGCVSIPLINHFWASCIHSSSVAGDSYRILSRMAYLGSISRVFCYHKLTKGYNNIPFYFTFSTNVIYQLVQFSLHSGWLQRRRRGRMFSTQLSHEVGIPGPQSHFFKGFQNSARGQSLPLHHNE